MAEYDNRDKGTLWFNKDKRSEKAPDWGGSFELHTDTLKKLIELAKANKKVEFKISGWSRTLDSGKKLVSLAVDNYEPKKNSDPLNDEVPF